MACETNSPDGDLDLERAPSLSAVSFLSPLPSSSTSILSGDLLRDRDLDLDFDLRGDTLLDFERAGDPLPDLERAPDLLLDLDLDLDLAGEPLRERDPLLERDLET